MKGYLEMPEFSNTGEYSTQEAMYQIIALIVHDELKFRVKF